MDSSISYKSKDIDGFFDKTYSTKGLVGSIKDMSFKVLWFSDESKKLFDNLDVSKSCRHHCTYDVRNMLVNEIIRCADEHVNFV